MQILNQNYSGPFIGEDICGLIDSNMITETINIPKKNWKISKGTLHNLLNLRINLI